MNYIELYTISGTVRIDNKALYIHRQADQDLLDLCRRGRFAYILTTRQVGKSSLMARTADTLLNSGMRCAMIDISLLGTQFKSDADWYLGLLEEIEDKLKLETDVFEWWEEHAHLSGTQRFSTLLSEVMQSEISEPVVIFIDEIDSTLRLEFTDDFFAAIRALYNARVDTPALRRLTFVLIGTTTPSNLIRDPQRTPFNIGERVQLTDFTRSEAMPLASGLGLPDAEAEQVLQKIFEWTNGHPYLTQRVCYEFARQPESDKSTASVDDIVARLFLSQDGREEHNIKFVHQMLIEQLPNPLELKEALALYRDVRRWWRRVPDESQSLLKSHLKLSGLIVRGQNGQLQVRNRIYEEVFNQQWIKEHWPDPWWHGYLTAEIAARVFGVLVVILLFISRFAQQEKQYAWFQSNANQALYELSQHNTNDALLFALAAVRTDPVAHPPWPSRALRKVIVCMQTLPRILDGNLEEICSAPVGYSPLTSLVLRDVIDSVDTLPSILGKDLGQIRSATWSPDGEYILIRDRNGEVQVWKSNSRVLAASLDTTQIGGAESAEWRPCQAEMGGAGCESMQILIAGEKMAQIWEWTPPPITGTVEFTPTRQDPVAWPPNDSWVVTGAEDGTAQVRDADRGTLEGHVASSPDGRYIVTASRDGVARVSVANESLLIAKLTERVCIVFERNEKKIKEQIPDWKGCKKELKAVEDDLKRYHELRQPAISRPREKKSDPKTHPMVCEEISDIHRPKDMEEGKELKILQWEHFVPQYDKWFAKCAQKWAEETGIKVTITRIDLAKLDSRTSAEIAAGEGHDLIEWLSPPSQFEPDVLDLSDVYEEVTKKIGGEPAPLCHKSTYNPHTDKRYGFAHGWGLAPGNYRRDLWEKIGKPDGPSTYDELLEGGKQIKEQLGVQMGIGMADELDSNMAIRAVLWSFGGSVQDDKDRDKRIEVTINSPETEEAVKYLVDLYHNAATPEVFYWNAASNNQGLVAGELSYIVNSPSAYRSAQKINPELAEEIYFTKPLAGLPDKAFVSAHVVFTYMIPEYSEVPEVAKAFLRYLMDNYDQAALHSELYNFPCWEKSAPSLDGWLDNDPFGSEPPNKLAIFKVFKNSEDSEDSEYEIVNNGYPGYANPAIGEVFDRHILPQMVRKAASGEMTPQEAVVWAESKIKPIFEKWQQRGLIELEETE